MLLEVDYQWNRIEGGWLLSERTLTVHRTSGPSLRHTVHVTRDVLAARGLPAAMLDRARGLLRRGTPAVLHAQGLKGCVSEYTVYAVVTTGVVAAEVAVVLQPWNPLAWVALTGAIALWEQALDDLVLCMYRLDEDG